MEGTLPFLGFHQGREGRTGANYFDIPEGGGGSGITPAARADIQAAAAAAADLDARLRRQVDNVSNLRYTVNSRFEATNKSIKEVKSVEKVQEKQIASVKKKDADLDARLRRQVDNVSNLRYTVNSRFAATNKSIKEVKSVENVQEKQIVSLEKKDASLAAEVADNKETIRSYSAIIDQLRTDIRRLQTPVGGA
jgi:chromosome segregation ATPase